MQFYFMMKENTISSRININNHICKAKGKFPLLLQIVQGLNQKVLPGTSFSFLAMNED